MAVFMKAIILSFLLFLFVFPLSAFAQEASLSGDVTPTPMQSTDYALPYPGLLPDNPLYPLKMLRDRVVLILISDTVKRAKFNLLQADKRLQAGLYLYNGNKSKVNIAISTISKSQNYYSDALSETEKAKREKHDIDGIINDLTLSSRKHRELLKDFEKIVPKENKEQVKSLLKKHDELQKRLDKLI